MKVRLQRQIDQSRLIIIVIIFVVIALFCSPTVALTQTLHAKWNGMACYAVYFPLFKRLISFRQLLDFSDHERTD